MADLLARSLRGCLGFFDSRTQPARRNPFSRSARLDSAGSSELIIAQTLAALSTGLLARKTHVLERRGRDDEGLRRWEFGVRPSL